MILIRLLNGSQKVKIHLSFFKSIFDNHNQLLASAPEILESSKMKIKYLTNNNKKYNQINTYEIKLLSYKFVVKTITNKLYIGSSDESILLQTQHIVYHTPYKISDK